MIRKLFSIVAVSVVFFTASVTAQKAEINFREKTFDFGQITEDGGNVSHVFEFTKTAFGFSSTNKK